MFSSTAADRAVVTDFGLAQLAVTRRGRDDGFMAARGKVVIAGTLPS